MKPDLNHYIGTSNLTGGTPLYNGILKCDMHVHSIYSNDSSTSIRDITRLWEKRGIISIVCDHDTIEGSVKLNIELRRRDRDLPVIIAEEILTSEGDIIGLFLTDEIPPLRTAAETLDMISTQGALSILPHPFSTLRSSTILPAVLDSIIKKVDIIEGYNGKMMRAGENHMASEYATIHKKPISVGSDAHSPPELGGCFMNMGPFDSPSEFLANLSRSTYGPIRSMNTQCSSSYSLR